MRANIFAPTFMAVRTLFFLILFFCCSLLQAQSDSVVRADSLPLPITDSLPLQPDTLQKDSVVRADTLVKKENPPLYIRFDTALFRTHPFYRFDAPIQLIATEKAWNGKEVFFYLLLALLLFFALVKNTFSRYLKDLSKLFFRNTVKQRQVKEQLMQAPLPSLLLNLLFFFSGALFVSIVLQRYRLGLHYNFWLLLLYCVAGLAAIYLVKFITLKICGWLFDLQQATDSYIFIVFTTNKIAGIVLLPLIILLAFTAGVFNQAVFTGSLLVVGALFIYRFFLSYVSIHRQVDLSFFHFILYLAAFEIAPLLLINKLLLLFLS